MFCMLLHNTDKRTAWIVYFPKKINEYWNQILIRSYKQCVQFKSRPSRVLCERGSRSSRIWKHVSPFRDILFLGQWGTMSVLKVCLVSFFLRFSFKVKWEASTPSLSLPQRTRHLLAAFPSLAFCSPWPHGGERELSELSHHAQENLTWGTIKTIQSNLENYYLITELEWGFHGQ